MGPRLQVKDLNDRRSPDHRDKNDGRPLEAPDRQNRREGGSAKRERHPIRPPADDLRSD